MSKIVAGGAAAESGVIEIGDRLLSVDAVDVCALPLKAPLSRNLTPFLPIPSTLFTFSSMAIPVEGFEV